MSGRNLFKLLLLAAIWGGSFIFMRLIAPSLGAVLTASTRLLIAGTVLVVYFGFMRFDLHWKAHWKQYALIGAVNSAIPFALYSFAALHIPASYSVILNSTSPFFGAFFAWLWLGERFKLKLLGGLLLGATGVALVVAPGLQAAQAHGMGPQALWAMLGCLVAALCYAVSGVYIKKHASRLRPQAIAAASQLLAGSMLFPFALIRWPEFTLTLPLTLNILALAIICSAVALVIYMKLMTELGPAKALTVTFLMPMFGMLWGALFLGETITLPMIAGAALILLGTGFVTHTSRARPLQSS